jgi:hypothetical protein
MYSYYSLQICPYDQVPALYGVGADYEDDVGLVQKRADISMTGFNHHLRSTVHIGTFALLNEFKRIQAPPSKFLFLKSGIQLKLIIYLNLGPSRRETRIGQTSGTCAHSCQRNRRRTCSKN